MRLYHVIPKALDAIWSEVVPILEESIKYADGKYHIDDVYSFIMHGDMHLWIIFDNQAIRAVIVTEFVNFPRKKILLLSFIAGNKAKDWLHLIDKFKDFAKLHECSAIEGNARTGWERVAKKVGFKKIHSTIQLDLKD